MSNTRKALLALAGQQRTLVIPKPFAAFTGSLEAGMFLNQLLYWADRATLEGGWVAKTDAEWQEELMLTRYTVRKTRKSMEEAGYLETEVRKFNGDPTVHYRIDVEEFTRQFAAFVSDEKPPPEGGAAPPNERKLDSEQTGGANVCTPKPVRSDTEPRSAEYSNSYNKVAKTTSIEYSKKYSSSSLHSEELGCNTPNLFSEEEAVIDVGNVETVVNKVSSTTDVNEKLNILVSAISARIENRRPAGGEFARLLKIYEFVKGRALNNRRFLVKSPVRCLTYWFYDMNHGDLNGVAHALNRLHSFAEHRTYRGTKMPEIDARTKEKFPTYFSTTPRAL